MLKVAFIGIVILTILINVVAFIAEKVYKNKLSKMQNVNNEN